MANLVEDIVVKDETSKATNGRGKDMAGRDIKEIYGKVSAKYAVFRSGGRVRVQYADDDAKGVEQRAALSPLLPIRGEINALFDGWSNASWFTKRRGALEEGLNSRIADAWIVALQGDAPTGLTLLTAVRDDLKAERESIGRLEYLLMAVGAGVAAVVLASILRAGSFGCVERYFDDNHTLLAVALGVLGALFSIAMNITSRAIHTDLRRRDNLVDATLRIGVGAVSAVILYALLKGGIVKISLGTTDLMPDGGAISVVIAFLAGFSELLVGKVLGTVVLATVGATADTKKTDTKAAGADEDHPRGQPVAGPAGGPVPPSAPQAEVPPDDPAEQGSGEDAMLAEDATDDSELPAADGGVEGGDTPVGKQ